MNSFSINSATLNSKGKERKRNLKKSDKTYSFACHFA